MENKPIDIVVTYVNQKDKIWQKDFISCKQKELNGNEDFNNAQAFGEDRYREWETLRYWFRGIENNCDWVNKVFLIVAYPSQIPKWLNVEYKKIKIVFHKDFIPKELLPTFNSNTIELFLPKIKELSDNYILCNDDFYFINKIDKKMFFVNNIPVNSCKKQRFLYYDTNNIDEHYCKMLNNDIEIISNYSGNIDYRYSLVHLPVAKSKAFELQILNDNYDKIVNSLKLSHFRNDNNYTRGIFEDSIKFMGKVIENNNLYSNSEYITLKSDVNFEQLKKLDMVCLNDTFQLDDFELTKKKQLLFFYDLFPNKSEYEKKN